MNSNLEWNITVKSIKRMYKIEKIFKHCFYWIDNYPKAIYKNNKE